MTDADLLTLIRNTPALKALADSGQDAALASAVPTYATVTTPKPLVPADILGKVSGPSAAKFANSPMFTSIRQAILAQDRDGLADILAVAAADNMLTQTEQTALGAVLAETVTTPDTSVAHEQVSRALNAIRPRGHYQADGSFVADPSGPIVARPISW